MSSGLWNKLSDKMLQNLENSPRGVCVNFSRKLHHATRVDLFTTVDTMLEQIRNVLNKRKGR